MRNPRANRKIWASVAMTVALGAAMVTTSAATGGGDGDDGKAASAFTQCMRDQGLSEFPDTTVTDDGRVVLDADGMTFDPFSSEYRDALEACQSELPEGSQDQLGFDLPSAPSLPEVGNLSDGECFDAPEVPEVSAEVS